MMRPHQLVKAMREAAAKVAEDNSSWPNEGEEIAAEIRAIPLPDYGDNRYEDPEILGPELARAYKHIEWLVKRGMGDSSDCWGVRINA